MLESLLALLVIFLIFAFFIIPLIALAKANMANNQVKKLSDQVHKLREEIRWSKSNLLNDSRPDTPAEFQSPTSKPTPPQPQILDTPPVAETPAATTAPAIPQSPQPSTHPAKPDQETVSPTSATSPTPSPKNTADQKTAAFRHITESESKPKPSPEKPKKKITLEELFSTKILVWVAGVALALAVAYFVKYSFDKGILSPGVRLSIGALFAIAMLIAGEYLRKTYTIIAQALSAAGIASLFAVNLAAVVLYPLIPQWLGFIFMTAITALAVVLSLRQGIFVAILGLLGGFLLPAFIGEHEQHPGILFTYLLLVETALVAIARKRNWWPVAALTFFAVMIWPIIWLVGGFYRPDTDSIWIALLLLGSFAVHIITDFTTTQSLDNTYTKISNILAFASGIAGLILLGLMAHVGDFTNMHWAFCALLSLGCIAVSRLNQQYEILGYIAAAASAILLLIWQKTSSTPLDELRYFNITASLGAAYAVAAYFCLYKSRHPARWAVFSALCAITYLLIAYFVSEYTFDHPWRPPLPWWIIAVILAVAYTLASIPLIKLRSRFNDNDYTLAAGLTAATTFVSLAIAFKLDQYWLTIALAIEIPLLAVINHFLRVKQLRAVAAILTTLVAARLLLNPYIFDYPISENIIFNWLLLGFGLPSLLLAVAAYIFNKSARDYLVNLLTAVSIALTFALVTLEIHHYFDPTNLKHTNFGLYQLSTFATAWLLLTIILSTLARKLENLALNYGQYVIAALALAVCVFGLVIYANPIAKSAQQIDFGQSIIFNYLIPTYAIPAALIFTLCWLHKKSCPEQWLNLAAAVAFILLFTLVGLEVQHAWQPDHMNNWTFSLIQWATYSIAWLIFAVIILALYHKFPWPVFLNAGSIIAAVAAATLFIGAGLVENPLWSDHDLGQTRILNWLLYIYGLPAVLIACNGYLLQKFNLQKFATTAGVLSLILLFALLNLEVRHWYNGPILSTGLTTHAETYTYSAAWLLFAALLLTGGILANRTSLRYASLVVMMLATCKVFLFDTSHLKDLYRVLSYLGLGLTLLAIAFVYQRFVFKRNN